MTVPGWLFDQLADHRQDMDDLEAKLGAWNELLEGAEELTWTEIDTNLPERVRGMSFARAWAAVARGDKKETIPHDPYPFEEGDR